MTEILKVTLVLLLFFSSSSYAFNWNKCKRSDLLDSSRGGWGTHVAYGLFNGLFSTSQFVSSTGACAAIGMNNEEKAKLFYAFNSGKILEDIARGNGEYYYSISELWGCKKNDAYEKIHPLRRDYPMLLNFEVEMQYKFLKERVNCGNG